MTTENSKQHEILNKITSQVSRVVIGKEDIKELLLLALLSQGHVLIEGFPGTAKTTVARTFAQVIGGRFKRIQGTPDMLPADILGFYHYRPDGGTTFMPGPIFANVILADELNRTTPRTQAALLEAMQEQQVTIERETHPLERPFIIIGSQAPFGGVGTSPLTDVQMDRFMFRIWSGFPSREEEQQILNSIDQISETKVTPVASLADIIALQQTVKKVHVADSITRYIIEIIDRLRQHQELLVGPSSRGSIALFRAARALAFVRGRDFVTPDDVKGLLVPALSHRLHITAEAEMDKVTPESIINRVASEVPVPKDETTGQVDKTGMKPEPCELSNKLVEKATNRTAETGDATKSLGITTTPENAAHPEPLAAPALPVRNTEETPPAATGANTASSPQRRLSRWEWAVIFCAAILAAVMITFGLLSLR